MAGTYMSSSSQLPISPPVFQKGRYMPTKSPHFFSFSARLNSSLPIECVLMMLNLLFSSAYNSWFHRMSSPRWSIVGFDADEDFGANGEASCGVAGAGRPESWGVGVADDMM